MYSNIQALGGPAARYFVYLHCSGGSGVYGLLVPDPRAVARPAALGLRQWNPLPHLPSSGSCVAAYSFLLGGSRKQEAGSSSTAKAEQQ